MTMAYFDLLVLQHLIGLWTYADFPNGICTVGLGTNTLRTLGCFIKRKIPLTSG